MSMAALLVNLPYSAPSTAASFSAKPRFTLSSSFSLQHPTTFAYNSLIRAETVAGRPYQALQLFQRMLADEALPMDAFTFSIVFKACALLPALSEGQQIHSLFLKSRFASSGNAFILTSLVHFYARCGRLSDARLMFDRLPAGNIACWNAMLSGYTRSGDLDSAYKLFDEMPERNVVSWNTMICGCVRNGRPWEALKLFFDFRMLGMRADEPTMVSVIQAVADLGLLGFGRKAHAYVTRCLSSFDGALGVALIDMYTKCGNIGAANNIFKVIESKNVGHWTSMIAGFAAHGIADASLRVFDDMMKSNIVPNDVTFVAVLNACSHGGLVYEGLNCFKLMKAFRVEPGVKHFKCLVDLFSRAGLIDEAMELVRDMPVEPSPVIWSTLVAACWNYGCPDKAKAVAGKLAEFNSSKGFSFVLLSNLYAHMGRSEDFNIVTKAMKDRALTKVPGFSWIEVDNQIHEFMSGDMLHFKIREIYGVLDNLMIFLRFGVGQESFNCNSLSF